MVNVIKCAETGMATILIKSSAGEFKVDILADELEQAIGFAENSKHNALREYLASFNPDISTGIEADGIEAVSEALIKARG